MTVNNGSGLTLGRSSILPIVAGCVIVTSLISTLSSTLVHKLACPQLISKVFVKTFTKGSMKHPKIYQPEQIPYQYLGYMGALSSKF